MSPDRISDKLADIIRDLDQIAGWSEDSGAASEVERVAATLADLRHAIDRSARLSARWAA